MKSHIHLKGRKKVSEKRFSISELHSMKMKDFEDYYNKLPDKIKEYEATEMKIEKLRKTLEKIEKEREGGASNGKELCDTRDKIAANEKKFKNLAEEIKKMKSKEDMYKYLSRASTVFYKMSINNENDQKNENENDQKNENKRDNTNNTDNTDNADEETIEQKAEVSKVNKVKSNRRKRNIVDDYVNVEKGESKGTLLKEFMSILDGSDVSRTSSDNGDLSYSTGRYMRNSCEECDGEIIYDSLKCNIVCTDCGFCKPQQDPDASYWCDHVDNTKSYRYKRLTYFIEHLHRFQAKECREIPKSVINKLLFEIKKRRIEDPNEITAELVKNFLKKLHLNSYYDNVNSIIRTLSGREAPKFPKDLEDQLVKMFMETQGPFEKNKHLIPERNNYLSYPYVIRQLLTIISHQENDKSILKFVKWFPLLKSRSKMWNQEKVWEKICEELGWPFFRTI